MSVENLIKAAQSGKRKRKADGDGAPEWIERCQTEENGRPIGNLANAALALRSDPAWRGLLAYDEMRRCVALNRPVPVIGRAEETANAPATPMQDAHVEAAQEWMQLSGIPKVGSATVHDALDLVAREHSYHPLREWLMGLIWDGIERLDDWLFNALGAGPDEADYTRKIARLFIISMVARVMRPGCKADYMLVLEGAQGTLKSTACRILAGEAHFSDCMPSDVTHKDAALHLRGKWLIEMAEMHTLTKTETAVLKAFLTRTIDIYRPPYGRLEVHEPRQCVFIGTTNLDKYLKDETGGRRFWPVRVGTIRLDRLSRDRDQLFAEAVAAYRAGEPWWPDAAFEKQHIAPRQAARYAPDAWHETIESYLSHEGKVTVTQVAREALNIQLERIDRTTQNRITNVMKILGWTPGKRTADAKWWVRGEVSH
jgi:predicted P-loop ATPase